MTTLTWNRIRPGRWLLKSADGRIWAAVTPYTDSEFACKNQYKATVMNSDLGKHYWTTGIGVGAAKRNLEKWLYRNACAVENFTIEYRP